MRNKNKIALCGTRSGYNKHLKNKEKPCNTCKLAQNEYDRYRFNLNPELKRERNKKHVNKIKKLESWRRREAKKKGNIAIPYSEEQVIETYGNICYLCSKEIDLNAPRKCGVPGWEYGLHIEHVVPISLNGADALFNVKPSHGICNLKKGSVILK